MSTMMSQITGVSIVYSTVCSGEHQRKHQCSASLAFVRGIRRWPANSPHNWGPVTRKMFPFDGVIKDQTLPAWVTPPSCPLLLRSMHEFCKMSSTSYCLNKSLASLKSTLRSVESFDLLVQWRRMFSWHADNHFIFTWLSQLTKFDQTQSSSHK